MKKGQEEIVGSVVIVVLGAVVLVVMLSIFLRTGEREVRQESRELYRFLEGVMKFTTNCTSASYKPEFYTVQEAIRECHSERTCSSGVSACQTLNETLSEILDSSWRVGLDSAYKGYELRGVYRTNSALEPVFEISKGNCSSDIKGADFLSPPFTVSFNLCS